VAEHRRILIVAEADIASTQLLMQVMRAAAPFGIDAGLVLARDWTSSLLPGAVTPLFARCADPAMLPFARALVEAGRPYLYYLDDNFWALDPATPIGAYYRHPSVRASLDFFVAHAALVLTHTPDLADALRRRGARVALVPTFFRFDLIAGIEPEASDEIRIGFAGSPGRSADLALVTDAVAPVLAADRRAVFEFIGATPPGIAAGERVRFFPARPDYAAFIAFQAARNWSIGLAPLLANASNRSKTDNKFREYAACGVAGIYSDFGPYPAVVADGVDGLLVADGGWTEAIGALVRAPDRLLAMRRAARDAARRRYDIGSAASAWARVVSDAVDGFPAGHLRPMSLARVRRRLFFQPLLGVPVRVQAAYRAGGARLVAAKAGRWLGRKIGARAPQ